MVKDLEEFIPVGKANSVFQRDLRDTVNLNKRELVREVNLLRKRGIPVCSTTYDGYWIADNREDILDTIRALDAKISTLQQTKSYLYDCLVNM